MEVQLVRLGEVERMNREGDAITVSEALFLGEGTSLILEVKLRGAPAAVSGLLQRLGGSCLKDIISVELKPNQQKKVTEG